MPEQAKRPIPFSKYHGAGNDFIAFNLRTAEVDLSDVKQMQMLCDRHLGIGADGILGISPSTTADFELTYLNADGRVGSLCGNGSRCAVAFALEVGLAEPKSSVTIEASDGLHRVDVLPEGQFKLHFKDVAEIKRLTLEGVECWFVNTGSPHVVIEVKDLESVDVYLEGKRLRNAKALAPEGANINFVQNLDDTTLAIRTFERGVEAETLACGTGAVAAALCLMKHAENVINIQARGGHLRVGAVAQQGIIRAEGLHFSNVWLTGPAIKVFEGFITL